MSREDKRFILFLTLMVCFFALSIMYYVMGDEFNSEVFKWVVNLMMVLVLWNIWSTKEKP